MREMTTQKAVQTIQEERPLSDYAIAKAIGVQPIMIPRYYNDESKMGLETAKNFEQVYEIKITDARRPGRQKNDKA